MKLFSIEEMRRRVKGLRAVMDKDRLDAVITSSFHSTLYYSGFWFLPMGRFAVTVVPMEGEPALIAPVMDRDRAEAASWIEDKRFYGDEGTSLAAVIEQTKLVLSDRGVNARRVGVEEDVIPQKMYAALGESLPQSEFLDVSTELMGQRLIKSAEEVQVLRAGAEISDVGTRVIMGAMAEGRTEIEVSNEALVAMDKELTVRFPELESYGTVVTCNSGPRSLLPHGLSSGRRLKAGEVINFNVLPIIEGYYVSQERTLSLGPLPEAAKKPYETVVEAHERGIEAVKAGARCSDVANACVDVLRREGYDQYQLHGPGHSCGIMGVFWGREEKGEIRVYNDNILHEGMVITVEPAIYLPGVGGFRHCDVLVVTDDGNELLTHYARGILRVG